MSTLESVLATLRDAVLDVPLKDVTRPSYSQTIAAPSFQLGDGDFAVAATPNTTLDLVVVNDPQDSSADVVFAGITGPDGSAVPPFIGFDRQKAWLKYRLTGAFAATAAPSIFALGANVTVSFAGYRMHAATENALAALDDDRRSFRAIIRRRDVEELQPGEALTMELTGSLTARVTFSWSDALAMSISELADLVAPGVPVTITLGAAATASATVKITDDFLVVMARPAAGLLRIAVSKAKSRTAGVSVGATLGAAVQAEVSAAALEGLLGRPVPDAQSLSDDAVELLAKRLGVDASRDAVARRIESLEARVTERLEKIAMLKATVGFLYEYQRVDASSAIVDYTLPDSLLAQDHELALRGDFAALVDRLAAGNGRNTLRFLNQRSVARTTGFGFHLGLGPWARTFRDSNARRFTERKNIAGARMLAFKGSRGYTADPLGDENDYTWAVDLCAQMTRYRDSPQSRDFSYGLAYLVTFTRGNLDVRQISRLADFASMWRIATPDAVQSALRAKQGRPATVSFQILFRHDALLETTRQIPIDDADGWAVAMAAAVPYLSFVPARRNVEDRVAQYKAVCALWLSSVAPSDRESWAHAIHNQLGGQFESSPQMESFLTMVTGAYANVRRKLAAFVDGVTQLPVLMESTTHDERDIEGVYAKLDDFWSQRPYVTASGVYLLNAAATAGCLGAVQRTMTVTSDQATVVARPAT